jgi:protein TonB
MTPNLKLVFNTPFASQPTSGMAIPNIVAIYGLALHHPQSLDKDNKKTSYTTVGLVIAAHIAAMAWLMYAKPSLPVIKEIPPMMVSLVSNPKPAPEIVPEIVPVIPEPPKPVVKKQTIVQKTVSTPTPTPVAPQPVAAEPVAVAEPTPPIPVVVAKTPEVVEKSVAKPEPEPTVEPPRFGISYLHNPAPEYPRMSRRAKEQGRVMLRVTVSAKGEAENVELEKSSGYSRLDEAAIQAVKKWTFEPARRSNQVIRGIAMVPVSFSLED